MLFLAVGAIRRVARLTGQDHRAVMVRVHGGDWLADSATHHLPTRA